MHSDTQVLQWSTHIHQHFTVECSLLVYEFNYMYMYTSLERGKRGMHVLCVMCVCERERERERESTSAPSKRPLPGKCPCTTFGGATIAASVQTYGILIPGKHPCGPKLCLSTHGHLPGTLRYMYVWLPYQK